MQRLISRALLLLTFLALTSNNIYAGPSAPAATSLSELKAQLLKLRNTDLNLTQRELWEQTAASLEAWTLRSTNASEQADALYHAALAYEEISKRANDPPSARLAVSLFERFCKQYEQDRRCPDGLLHAAELCQVKLSDEQSAKNLYSRISNDYSSSEAAIIARAQLKQQGRGPTPIEATPLKPLSDQSGREAQGLAVVVIDPGHGGDDLGASGPGGLLEKDVVLAIALEVRDLAARQMNPKTNFKVMLTRDLDRFIPLAQRTAIANNENSRIFVSIHVNASPTHSLSGIESYYLDNTDDYAAKRLAEIENAAGAQTGGSDLDFILSDMVQGAKVPQSAELAQTLHREVIEQIQSSSWRGMRDYGVKKAPFFVLVGARMPCVLMELGYIDHQSDGQNLANPEFRSTLARGILGGIIKYLDSQTIKN